MSQQFAALSLWSLWCTFTEPARRGPRASFHLLLPALNPNRDARALMCSSAEYLCACYPREGFTFLVSSNFTDRQLDGVSSVFAPFHLK